MDYQPPSRSARRAAVNRHHRTWKNRRYGPVGFPNRHLRECYAISVLQALIHHPPLVDFLRYYHGANLKNDPEAHSWEQNGITIRCPLCDLCRLAITVWEGSSMPKNRKREVARRVSTFMDDYTDFVGAYNPSNTLADHSQQQDAGEFYLMVGNWVQVLFERNFYALTDYEHQQAALAQLLRLNLQIRFSCDKCRTESMQSSTESSLTRTINIPSDGENSSYRLEDLVPNTFGAPGKFGHCNKCKDESTGTKRLVISAQPNLLCFEIQHSTKHIDIPAEIDLGGYSDGSITSSLNYRLQAVVKRCGQDTEYGHYIVFTRPDDNWFLINDEECIPTTLEQVQSNARIGKRRFRPKLVFYALQNEGGSLPPSPEELSAVTVAPEGSGVQPSPHSHGQPDVMQPGSSIPTNDHQDSDAQESAGAHKEFSDHTGPALSKQPGGPKTGCKRRRSEGDIGLEHDDKRRKLIADVVKDEVKKAIEEAKQEEVGELKSKLTNLEDEAKQNSEIIKKLKEEVENGAKQNTENVKRLEEELEKLKDEAKQTTEKLKKLEEELKQVKKEAERHRDEKAKANLERDRSKQATPEPEQDTPERKALEAEQDSSEKTVPEVGQDISKKKAKAKVDDHISPQAAPQADSKPKMTRSQAKAKGVNIADQIVPLPGRKTAPRPTKMTSQPDSEREKKPAKRGRGRPRKGDK